MPTPASADPGGSPKAIYQCYEVNNPEEYVVQRLGQCNTGVITIYSTYDAKTHGQIEVLDGERFTGMTFKDFEEILKAVTSFAARKLWRVAKKYWTGGRGEDPDLPIDLWPVE